MARSTVYNQITSPEKIAQINSENKMLVDDFLDYLESVGLYRKRRAHRCS